MKINFLGMFVNIFIMLSILNGISLNENHFFLNDKLFINLNLSLLQIPLQWITLHLLKKHLLLIPLTALRMGFCKVKHFFDWYQRIIYVKDISRYFSFNINNEDSHNFI
jgi:hypothetical protein